MKGMHFDSDLPVTTSELERLAKATLRIYQSIGYDLDPDETMEGEAVVEICLDGGRLTDTGEHELQEIYHAAYNLGGGFGDEIHTMIAAAAGLRHRNERR